MGALDYGGLVNYGTAQGNAALDANSATNQRMMQKVGAGSGLNAPDFYAHASQDIAGETAVIRQNFGARMKEEQVRAQLHQGYMNHMWREIGYQQKALRMSELGAVLGTVGGLAGGILGAKQPASTKIPTMGNNEPMYDPNQLDGGWGPGKILG